MDISERQKKLLLLIISEFIGTAEAVGSISLQNKYHFDLSPATIRNEMADLVFNGFLYQKHNSGGRIPTTKGWRYFVEDLLQNFDYKLSDNRIEGVHSQLYKLREDRGMLIREAVNLLSKIAGNATVGVIGGTLYYSGLSEMVNIPEFKDSESLQKILRILEDYKKISELLNKGLPDNDLNIIIGEESQIDDFKEYAVVFSEIRLDGNNHGFLAVIGPNRMKYEEVLAGVKNISETVRLLLKEE